MVWFQHLQRKGEELIGPENWQKEPLGDQISPAMQGWWQAQWSSASVFLASFLIPAVLGVSENYSHLSPVYPHHKIVASQS